MTLLEEHLQAALRRIASYESVKSLRRQARRDYGLSAEEAIEMAYENVITEAKRALKGVARIRTAIAKAARGAPHA